jgi:hypothetical protein
MAFVLLLLLLVGRGARGRVVVSLVAVGIAEQGALIVPARRLVGRTRRWWRVWTRGQMRRRIPLCAASGLLYIVPSLAVLVPLLDPA